jgi:hypothetical protein
MHVSHNSAIGNLQLLRHARGLPVKVIRGTSVIWNLSSRHCKKLRFEAISDPVIIKRELTGLPQIAACADLVSASLVFPLDLEMNSGWPGWAGLHFLAELVVLSCIVHHASVGFKLFYTLTFE